MSKHDPDFDQAAVPASGGADTCAAWETVLDGAMRVEPTTPASQQHPVNPDAVAPVREIAFADRYSARSLLGQGGMGEVLLCRDNLIGREVALKVVRRGTGSQPGVTSRFVREARIQGQLEHPAIVPVYDLGLQPDGSTFFTMKRVRGQTFAEIVEALARGDVQARDRFSLRRLLGAFSRVCLAVHFAHSRGVLHRDLKPGNVMVGDFGEVHVLDWGLAKLVDDVDEAPGGAVHAPMETEARTIDGSLMGTPGYLAPEQARGRGADARSDVYALGCILFELLSLEPLHGRDTGMALIASTLVGADARVTARVPHLDTPPELDAICVKATALEPGDRYATARDLHDAIERYLDGDRDLELRRQLAAEHARAAADAAERVGAGNESSLGARREALREVGRALALDAANASALRTLVELLVEPPREVPPEARVELDTAAREQSQLAARMAGVGYLLLFPLIPLFLWMGIRDWTWSAVILALGVAAIALSIFESRRARPVPVTTYVLLGISTVAVVATSRMFGPFMLLPSLAVVNTIGFVITPMRRARFWFIACGCAAIIIPVAIEWLGGWSPSYLFSGDAMTISPQMHFLHETPTMVFLLLANLGILIGSALAIGRIRDELTHAEQRLRLQSWQLQQLIPDEARGLDAIPGALAPGPAR